MTRREPRLARRRLEPTYLHAPEYVETFGPEVADICGLAGFYPDPEQQLMLDLVFGIGTNGLSVAFSTTLIGPRQVMGKTGLIKMAELGWLYVTEERLIVHSAHELDTTAEAFADLRKLIEETPDLAKHLDPEIGERDSPGIKEGNGRWLIQLTGDRRVRYKARTKTGGRGLTGNKIVLDEGFALLRSHMGSLLPTLAVVPDPQLLIASSAGRLASEVLREHRNTGRAGTDPRQAYGEWSDPHPGGCKTKACDHHKTRTGCALDDERRWPKFMPALGRRATVETIRALRQNMPADEFAYELMVWWEDPPNGDAAQVINQTTWAGLTNVNARMPTRPAMVMLDVAPNRAKATIGMAAATDSGKILIMVLTAPGTSWVVPKLKMIRGRQKISEVALHPGSQAAVLIPELIDERIDFTPLTTAQMGQACAWFIENVPADPPKFEHVGQLELAQAIANARTRDVGEQQEVWDRKDRSIDITAVVAGSTAAHRLSLTNASYAIEDSLL